MLPLNFRRHLMTGNLTENCVGLAPLVYSFTCSEWGSQRCEETFYPPAWQLDGGPSPLAPKTLNHFLGIFFIEDVNEKTKPPPYMSVSQRYGLHEIDSLGVDLDEREDVSSLHGFTQRVEAGRRVQTLFGKALLCVFGYDEVFSRLPDYHTEKNKTFLIYTKHTKT